MTKQETTGLLVVAAGTAVVWGLALLGVVAAALARFGRRAFSRGEKRVALAAAMGAALEVGCFAYGVLIEANRLEVTHEVVVTPKLPRGTTVRIAHLSDLHVDRDSPTLRKLVEAVKAEKPDLVVFTGDSVNAADGLPVLRAALLALEAPLGRFAVKGNHDVHYWSELDLFGGGVATELEGTLPVEVGPLSLCGAPYGQGGALDECIRAAGARPVLVAYHTPDLIEELDPRPTLYLAGHTHGGQVRVPFYGAVVTLARHGKKYEMGRYEVNDTTLYVNRGIGFEPHAPRVRFLAPPELTIIELRGAE